MFSCFIDTVAEYNREGTSERRSEQSHGSAVLYYKSK